MNPLALCYELLELQIHVFEDVVGDLDRWTELWCLEVCRQPLDMIARWCPAYSPIDFWGSVAAGDEHRAT